MRYSQNRFESNLHFWQDRRKRFKDPVVVYTAGNIRSEKVDTSLYGDFMSTPFERGGPRYFMFEGRANAELFVEHYSAHRPTPYICEDPKP